MSTDCFCSICCKHIGDLTQRLAPFISPCIVTLFDITVSGVFMYINSFDVDVITAFDVA